MTAFGRFGLLAVFVILLVVVLDPRTEDHDLKVALILLSGVTLGAIIAVEARAAETVIRKRRRDKEEPDEWGA